jgi:hypothetical protein
VADTGEDVCAIFFNFLAAAASVAELAAVQVAVYGFDINGQAGRQPGKEGQEGLTVGFTRCVETKHR